MARSAVVRRFDGWVRRGEEDVAVATALEYSTGLVAVYFEPGAVVHLEDNLIRLVPQGTRSEDHGNDWDDDDTQPERSDGEITKPGLPHNVVRPRRKR
jgi:hypothetical protein